MLFLYQIHVYCLIISAVITGKRKSETQQMHYLGSQTFTFINGQVWGILTDIYSWFARDAWEDVTMEANLISTCLYTIGWAQSGQSLPLNKWLLAWLTCCVAMKYTRAQTLVGRDILYTMFNARVFSYMLSTNQYDFKRLDQDFLPSLIYFSFCKN